MEPLNEFLDLPEYNQLVKQVETAINRDIMPERIYQVNFELIFRMKFFFMSHESKLMDQ